MAHAVITVATWLFSRQMHCKHRQQAIDMARHNRSLGQKCNVAVFLP